MKRLVKAASWTLVSVISLLLYWRWTSRSFAQNRTDDRLEYTGLDR